MCLCFGKPAVLNYGLINQEGPGTFKLLCSEFFVTSGISFPFSSQFFLSLYGHKLPVLCMDISYVSMMSMCWKPWQWLMLRWHKAGRYDRVESLLDQWILRIGTTIRHGSVLYCEELVWCLYRNVSQHLSPTVSICVIHLLEVSLEVTCIDVSTRYFRIGKPDATQQTLVRE